MNDLPPQNDAATIDQTFGQIPPPNDPSSDNEVAPRWISLHSSELANISAVILVSVIAFITLSIVTGGITWLENQGLSGGLLAVLLFSLMALIMLSQMATWHEEANREINCHVISETTLRTLRAEGLPDDFLETLQEMLAKAKTLRHPKTELIVKDMGDRTVGSWIRQLESELGKARVKEHEELLLKYTSRRKVPEQVP